MIITLVTLAGIAFAFGRGKNQPRHARYLVVVKCNLFICFGISPPPRPLAVRFSSEVQIPEIKPSRKRNVTLLDIDSHKQVIITVYPKGALLVHGVREGDEGVLNKTLSAPDTA